MSIRRRLYRAAGERLGVVAALLYWPPTNADQDRLDSVSQQIIGAAFEVANTLGAGFVEKVYERALFHELASRGLQVESQARLKVFHKKFEAGSTSLTSSWKEK
jgi:hypothetical protein